MGSEMFSSSWVGGGGPVGKEATTTMKTKNFARTCNRFSQFLKERRGFGDNKLGFEMKKEMMILPTNNNNNNNNNNNVEMKSLDLFPLSSSSSTLTSDDSLRESLKSVEEPKKTPNTASMTIFYDGKVMVLEDLPEEMAQEILSLVNQGGGAIAPRRETPRNDGATASFATHLTQGFSDIPLVRRASLHRFMERRKDRIAATAPYQVKSSSSSKQMFKQQEEHQLELKLW